MTKLPDQHSLDELCLLVDLPKRKVKFYIEKGMIDRPVGAKRGAYYSQRHVEQLLEIKKWQGAGLTLERIKSLLDDKDSASPIPPPKTRHSGDIEVWSHVYIKDGVELLIEPRRSGLSSEQVLRLCRALHENLANSETSRDDPK